jgi:hypothetical protein
MSEMRARNDASTPIDETVEFTEQEWETIDSEAEASLDEDDRPPAVIADSEVSEDDVVAEAKPAEEPSTAETEAVESELDPDTAEIEEEVDTKITSESEVAAAPEETVTETVVTETPTDWAKQYQESRRTAFDHLVKSYQLSEEETVEFETSPADSLPKLGAKIVLDAIESSVQAIEARLPQLIEQYQSRKSAEQQFTDKFFKKWPELKTHIPTVSRIGAAYRSHNPKATPDQYIDEVGATAMVALRKQIPEQGATQIKTPSRPPAASRPSSAPRLPPKGPPTNEEETFAAYDVELEQLDNFI